MIVLELTQDEALALRNLMDLAVRSGGMRAAEIAVVIDAKIQRAAAAHAQQLVNGAGATT